MRWPTSIALFTQSIRFLFFFITLLLTYTTTLHAHREDNRVSLKSAITKSAAGKIIYQFQLVDNKLKKTITEETLNEVHEKKLHLIAYDPSLNEFHHAHPEYKNKTWEVMLDIPVNGNYWIWVQGEISEDVEEFSATTRLMISNGTKAWPPPALKDLREGVSGISKAVIDSKKLNAGKMVMLNLKFSRTDGKVAQITPYLGAFAHIVAVPENGNSLLHVHPMDSAKPDMGMIHVTFPKKGFYRLWVQFIDNEELKVIPLAVRVH